MRILLIEDEKRIANFIERGLKENHYAVDTASDGEKGLFMSEVNIYDLIILDVMLPGKDGISVCQELRKKKIDVPVLILTAKDTVRDKVLGLNSGADDYLTKPFAFSELLARVQALIRRNSGASEPTRLSVGGVSMNLIARDVYRSGKKIDLQPLEFALLEYLMRNAGRVVSKTMIMEHVWDYHFDPQTNVVESRIYRLREKIDKDFSLKLIHTVRGVGYVFKEAG